MSPDAIALLLIAAGIVLFLFARRRQNQVNQKWGIALFCFGAGMLTALVWATAFIMSR